jgi:hypothetical protein
MLEHASVVWHTLTFGDSNKLENIQIKFANLYYNRFIQSSSLCNCEWILHHSHFKKLYSRRQNLDALFLVNVFKNKTGCCSVMDTAGLRALTEHTRNTSIFSVSDVSRLSASTRRVTTANICKSLGVFNKHDISLEHIYFLFNRNEFMFPVASLPCPQYYFIIYYLIFILVLVLVRSMR